MTAPESSEHQMTIDECIEVAEHNLDGKGVRVTMPSSEPEQAKRQILIAAQAARHYLHRKDHK